MKKTRELSLKELTSEFKGFEPNRLVVSYRTFLFFMLQIHL